MGFKKTKQYKQSCKWLINLQTQMTPYIVDNQWGKLEQWAKAYLVHILLFYYLNSPGNIFK